MCGISGILGRFEHREEQEATVTDMAAAIVHRGPDGWGTYVAPEMAFGHTRLSIVDPGGGHQPMRTERWVVCYNGEIYNHIELRQQLQQQGVSFTTDCDTEVLLRLFECDGPEAFKQLNGQFAIMLWDRTDKTLTVARDRYGMRPLYVMPWHQRIYFASEMKCFDTLDGFSRSMSAPHLLEHAVLWNTLGDSTVYDNIRSVEAGTYEVYKGTQCVSTARYYELGDTVQPDSGAKTLGEAQEQLESLLQNSVDLRLRSDVPVGAYLSGGIDSTVIAQLCKKRKQDDFKTFSVGFDDPSLDESNYQRMVSEDINSQHVGISVSDNDIEEHFSEVIYHTERPIFRTAPVPLFLLSKRVAESDIKVVLTGEGADEILFGYDSFKELAILRQWNAAPDSDEAPELLKQLYPHLKHYADPKKFGMMRLYYEEFLDDFDNDLTGLNIRASNNKILARYLNKDLGVSYEQDHLLERLRATLPSQFHEWTLLQRQSYLEIRSLLQGYLLSSQGDRMALGHSIEGRYPFLDHRVVDTCFHMRDHFKLHDFSQKHVLREAFRGKVVTEVLDRPKRPYMAPDLVSFFRDGQLKEHPAHLLSDEVIKHYGIFDPKFVRRFVHKFTKRAPQDTGYRDNMLITFMLSTHLAMHWAQNPKRSTLDPSLQRVRLQDYA